MRIGSLFSGAGGLDMAVEEVFGGEVIWQAEVDKAASKVLAYRFPCAPNLGDITKANWNAADRVDVICGGFPCQDVSAAGKRAGLGDGTRSGLWAEMARIIGLHSPRYVVIENVRGLLSATAHRSMESADPVMGDGSDRPVLRALGAVLGDLADLGYDAQWTTVAAADVGAPHRRERVFVLATHADPDEGGWGGRREASWGDLGRHNEIDGRRGSIPTEGRSRFTSDPQGDRWDEGRPESARIVGGFDAAVGGDGLCRTCGHEQRLHCDYIGRCTKPCECPGWDEGPVDLLPTPTAQSAKHGAESRFGGGNGDLSNLWQIAHLLPTPVSRDHKGRNQRDDDSCLTGALLPTPRASDPCGAESRSSEGFRPQLGEVTRSLGTAWGKYEPAIRRWEALTRPAPAPTEPNKNGNPRLSATFSEWLMGWPHYWVTDPDIGISRNDQLKIVGNGVCPQQAAAALRYLLNVAEAVA